MLLGVVDYFTHTTKTGSTCCLVGMLLGRRHGVDLICPADMLVGDTGQGEVGGYFLSFCMIFSLTITRQEASALFLTCRQDLNYVFSCDLFEKNQ